MPHECARMDGRTTGGSDRGKKEEIQNERQREPNRKVDDELR